MIGLYIGHNYKPIFFVCHRLSRTRLLSFVGQTPKPAACPTP